MSLFHYYYCHCSIILQKIIIKSNAWYIKCLWINIGFIFLSLSLVRPEVSLSVSATSKAHCWPSSDIAKAARLLAAPPMDVAFIDEVEMRRVYSLIYDVFRCKFLNLVFNFPKHIFLDTILTSWRKDTYPYSTYQFLTILSILKLLTFWKLVINFIQQFKSTFLWNVRFCSF